MADLVELGLVKQLLFLFTSVFLALASMAQKPSATIEKAKSLLGTKEVQQVPGLLRQIAEDTLKSNTYQREASEILGDAYSYLADFDSAIYFYDKALNLLDPSALKPSIGALEKLGAAYENIGNSSLALESYITAIKRAESLNLRGQTASLEIRIGDLYLADGKLFNAGKFFNKARRRYQKLNNEIGLATAIYSFGKMHLRYEQPDSAQFYLEKALDMLTSQNAKTQMAEVYNQLGFVSLELEDWEKAIERFNEALEIRRSENNLAAIPEIYSNVSDAYLKGQRYDAALREARKGLEMAVKTQSGTSKLLLSQQLYKIFSDLNYGDSAIIYYETYVKLKDSIAGLDNKKLAIRLRTQFEADQREAELERLRELNQAKDSAIKKQWYLTISIGIIALMSIVLVFFLYNRNELKRRAHLAITRKNAENVLLLKELHHRVKNNLQFIASMMSIQRSKIDDKGTRQELKESLQKVQAMAMVHNKLYRKGGASANLTFKKFLAELTDSLALSYGFDTDQIRVLYGWKKVNFDIDTYNALGLILNEMVTNSFKHCHEDVQIKMIFREQKGKKSIVYSDNGPGIDTELTPEMSNTGTVLIQLLADEMNSQIHYIPNTEDEKGIKIVLDLKNK